MHSILLQVILIFLNAIFACAEIANKMLKEMTDEQAYTLLRKANRYADTLPEPEWSKKEGHWERATEAGIVDGSSPERPMKRDEFIAVLGRNGLL